MNETESNSCLNCKFFNRQIEKFCKDYPKRLSKINIDIIGGFKCVKHEIKIKKKKKIKKNPPNSIQIMQQIMPIPFLPMFNQKEKQKAIIRVEIIIRKDSDIDPKKLVIKLRKWLKHQGI